ncbi:hypothetical protein [Janibacter melonis]|uniref:hypothetical protein n=1 Tax=Janibacter melonis TaxID=262209 RepID=UPI0027DA613E|nr:hypothetical protein [Janibacter melonis]
MGRFERTRTGRAVDEGTPVLAIGLVLAAVAALIHVYIFVLESLQWTGDAA